jgi:hypothetical protein
MSAANLNIFGRKSSTTYVGVRFDHSKLYGLLFYLKRAILEGKEDLQ